MKESAKQVIDTFITSNGNQEITGDRLNFVLTSMVEEYDEKATGLSEKIDNLPKGAFLTPVTYIDLVNLRNSKQLVEGTFYRITDYITTTSQLDTQSAMHPFDVIVLALSEDTLAEEAYAIQSVRDTDGYFANSNLAAWKLWYCLDNDTERFAWADDENGKGVIYRMIDEWENDCPYDFKNILFIRYELNAPEQYEAEGEDDKWIERLAESVRTMFDGGVHSYIWSGVELGNKHWEDGWFVLFSTPTTRRKSCYTFSDMENAEDRDTTSDASLSNSIRDNKMRAYFDGDYYRLPNNVFFGNYCYSNSFGNDCYSNSFGNDCNYNSFGNYCNSNSFGNYCYINSFGDGFRSNRLGNDCYTNSFGNGCYTNSFGNGCYSNSFGNGCGSNSFGNDCSSHSFGNDCGCNSFGNDCSYNSFGNDCGYNSFGNGCCSNSFGNGCGSNSFGNDCSYNSFGNDCYSNSFGDGFRSNSFGNDCYSNSFVDDGEGDGLMPSRGVKHCVFDDGVFSMKIYIEFERYEYHSLNYLHLCRGVSEDEIYPTPDLNYEVTYARKSNGNIAHFVLADLKAS